MRRFQVRGVVLIIAVAAALLRHVALSLPPTCSATDKEATASCPSTSTLSSPGNCGFPAIFNFGDSNSDTGAHSATLTNYPLPLGETYFHHSSGRSSDGRLIIDFMAESLGFPYLSPYLDSIGPNFTHGVNFAFAGSTIRIQNTNKSEGAHSPVPLDVQFIQFCQFQTRSQLVRNQGGVFAQLLPDEKVFSSALYTIDIGHNDITAGFKLLLSAELVKAEVPDMIRQLSNKIQNISARGGKTFWIHSTGPLGCMPDMLNRFPLLEIDEHGCSKPVNEVAQLYNLKLKEMVAELRILLPLASITYVDIYSAKYSLISNAKTLGFDDPFFVCYCHTAKFKSGCGDVNGAQLCEKPQSRISWDGIHYTEAANKWIFDQIVNGSFSDPPVPLNSACQHKVNP